MPWPNSVPRPSSRRTSARYALSDHCLNRFTRIRARSWKSGTGANLQSLGDTAHGTLLVVEHARTHADAVRTRCGFGGDTDPLSLGHTEDMHREICVEKRPVLRVELGADPFEMSATANKRSRADIFSPSTSSGLGRAHTLPVPTHPIGAIQDQSRVLR